MATNTQRVTGSLKLEVQQTGTSNTNTWVNRDVNITDSSSTLNYSVRRKARGTTTVAPSTVAFALSGGGPMTSATMLHLRASGPIRIGLRVVPQAAERTMVLSQLYIEKAQIVSLSVAKATAAGSYTVDILLVGR
jgi:hypothetical protein